MVGFMPANTHQSESQSNLLAFNNAQLDTQYAAVARRRSRNKRRRRARFRLPVWQAALLFVLLASITLLFTVRTLMGWFSMARAAYTVYEYFASGSYAMVSAEIVQTGESTRYSATQIAPAIVEPVIQIRNLSPAWPDYISQWNEPISAIAAERQLDPDLIGSIVEAESTGNYYAVSYAGAVGLMGVMPYGPGFFDRPTSDRLIDPVLNLETGTGILVDFVRLAEYDLHYGLAAYNGGMGNALAEGPQFYAEGILEQYARIVAAREGIDPESAFDWVLGYEVWQDSEVTYYNQSPTSAEPIGRHTIFTDYDADGNVIEIVGYALPIGTFNSDS